MTIGQAGSTSITSNKALSGVFSPPAWLYFAAKIAKGRSVDYITCDTTTRTVRVDKLKWVDEKGKHRRIIN
tara:strand:- start:137 stop:349 length:213 start_codon:yes stop_codon:yes gene_type:complete